jgi:uncharacterized cupin superfamily protein
VDWFVTSAREAQWVEGDTGLYCGFEDERGGDLFARMGLNVRILQPSQAIGMYHSEAGQEDFLVLAGEGLAVVEGEERPLKKWDLLHCEAGVAHMVKATGNEPLLLACSGARTDEPRNGIMYVANDVAATHGISVAADTPDNTIAYAGYEWRWADYEDGWLP